MRQRQARQRIYDTITGVFRAVGLCPPSCLQLLKALRCKLFDRSILNSKKASTRLVNKAEIIVINFVIIAVLFHAVKS